MKDFDDREVYDGPEVEDQVRQGMRDEARRKLRIKGLSMCEGGEDLIHALNAMDQGYSIINGLPQE